MCMDTLNTFWQTNCCISRLVEIGSKYFRKWIEAIITVYIYRIVKMDMKINMTNISLMEIY